MLKGHIDTVRDDAIEGWVYSPHAPLAGATILAFLDDQCIGAGTVGLHRPDLQAAGLGDGRSGFAIACSPHALRAAGDLTVRLDHSDFMLRARRAAAAPDFGGLAHRLPFGEPEAERLRWLGAQGWVAHAPLSAALALVTQGSYVRTLSQAERAAQSPSALLRQVFAEVMSLMLHREVVAAALVASDTDDPAGALRGLRQRAADEQYVLIFDGALDALLRPGAHHPGVPADAAPLQQRLSAHQALIVHPACVVDLALLGAGHCQVLQLPATPSSPGAPR